MKLIFGGATKTTTGSKYLLELNGSRVLLECGMYQGKRAVAWERNNRFPFDPRRIDAVALSHAHIDHSGILPVLVKQGFEGPIYCTAATRDLCEIMLVDSGHIQENDAVFVSKKHAKRGLPPAEPLFTQVDARAALERFTTVPYHQPVTVAGGVRVTWVEAGHILGSASLVVELEGEGRRLRLGFSADIGRGHNDMLPDPEPVQEVDYLMIESTYGGREHEDQANINQRVCSIVRRALDRRGKVIIPAFAVGRIQQLLYTLGQLIEARCIPSLPVYVDSPLAVNATAIFERHMDRFNSRFQKWMRENGNPFARMNITYICDVQDSMRLNDLREPCIILSASGMAEAGRIRHHIKNNIGDDRNTILIVGFCPPDTLGGRLAAGAGEVNIFGEPYAVRAKVEVMDAFSGHADGSELRDYVDRVTGSIRGCFVVHGEESQANAMAQQVRRLKPQAEVIVPEYLQQVEL